MKSGAIHVITEPGRSVSNDAAPLERQERGETLRSSVQFTNDHGQATLDFDLEDGTLAGISVQEGKILREELIEHRSRRLDENGRMVVDNEGVERAIEEVKFVHVPERLLVTARTGCDAALSEFEMVSGAKVEPAGIDIKSFEDAHPDTELRLEWAEDQEGEFGPVCLVARDDSPLPSNRRTDPDERAQLTFDHLAWDGRRLFGTITASGYVELYRDQNGGQHIGTQEFTRFVIDEVMPHVTLPT